MTITQQLARLAPEEFVRCRADVSALRHVLAFGLAAARYLDLDWAPTATARFGLYNVLCLFYKSPVTEIEDRPTREKGSRSSMAPSPGRIQKPTKAKVEASKSQCRSQQKANVDAEKSQAKPTKANRSQQFFEPCDLLAFCLGGTRRGRLREGGPP